MKTDAAILVQCGEPLELAELEIPELKPGQVLVEIAYSGMCHTQIQEIKGLRGEDRFLPHCLGHEASGVVLSVGEDVIRTTAGDRVALSWIKNSGLDAGGTVYDWNGKAVNAGPVTTFQRHAVVSENRVNVIPDGLDFPTAVLLGCAAPTALGAVFNTANPVAGDSLAVFGAGGIGLCAIAAAKVRGCSPIIAVDLLDNKLKMASDLGATHCLNAANCEVSEEISKICVGGVDYAVEATGNTAVMSQALEAVRNFGGTTVVVGNPPFGAELTLDPWQIIYGKRFVGAWSGDDDTDRDFPLYAALLEQGDIDASVILAPPTALENINQVIDDMIEGRIGRPLIDMTM